MNTRFLMPLVTMSGAIVALFAGPVVAATILLNVETTIPALNGSPTATQKTMKGVPGESGNGSKIHDLAEDLLAQYLHRNAHTVVTANELATSKWITAQEIQAGRSGKTIKLRKMAALNDASVTFNASMGVQTTREDLIGVKMSVTILTMSYKLIETASGDTLDIDSHQYTSTAKTDGFAQHSAMDKMATDIARRVAGRLSATDMDQALSGLAAYKLKVMQAVKAADARVKPVPKPAAGEVKLTTKSGLVLSVPEDKQPPEIILIQPPVSRGFAVVLKKPLATIDVTGIVRDDSPILYLSLNGTRTNLGADGYFSGRVAIHEKVEKIVIESMDQPGNKTIKEFQIRASDVDAERGQLYGGAPSADVASKPALWGLAIGVSTYDSKMTDLKYAHKDAGSLSDFFATQDRRLYSEVHFKTLVNEEVTRDSIIENLTGHLGQAAPQDVVFIFMAGHGVKHAQTGSYYFLPHDVDSSNLVAKGLRISDFEESLNILSGNVNKLILAMDTCHSGALNLNVRADLGGENLAAVLKESTGVYVLAAAKSGEVSLENDRFKLNDTDSGHGVFTYTLIDGMMGKANADGDGYISLNELFQFVAKQVPRLTQGRQHPFFRSAGTDLPLVMIGKAP